MESLTLQTLACRSYLGSRRVGTRIPCDIPGTIDSFVKTWMELIGFQEDEDVCGFIVDCLTSGTATRHGASYPFRRRVEILSDTIGIDRGPHKRNNLSDVVIKVDPGFQWKKRKVTRAMRESWDEFSPGKEDPPSPEKS
jgi:hypothetical protein